MKLEDVIPPQCYARANRLLGEIKLVRTAMGRAEDTRAPLALTNASPRDCFATATTLWDKANRLSDEVDAENTGAVPLMPALDAARPGHVLGMLDAVLERVMAIKTQLGLTEVAPEPAIEPSRQPSDVLVTIVQCCRELSRCMERPFAPRDCFRQVELASAYAVRLPKLRERTVAAAAFAPNRRPADCYATLQRCLVAVGQLLTAAGHTAVTLEGAPADVLPGDVFDLATIVLGQVAFLHTVTPGATPLYAFNPLHDGHRLPSHVDQAATTLLAQLAALR